MLRSLPVAGLVLAAIATTAAAPAAACSEILEWVPYGPTFAGRTIPLNGELWMLNTEFQPTTAYVFTGPDGTEQRVEVGDEADNGAILITEVTLQPGSWRLVDVDYGNEWTFDVSDTVDDAPPAPPAVTVETFTQGSPLALIFGCGDPTPESRRRFTIAVDPAEIGQVTFAGRRFLVEADVGALSIETADDGVAHEFTAIDHAGNESEPVSLGASGGGCASMPASTSLFAALLLLVRRRRRSQS